MIIGLPDTCSEETPYVSPNYVNAVTRAGHEVRILPYSLDAEVCKRQLEGIDALIFVGGGDIAARWFHQPQSPLAKAPNERRDAYEFFLLDLAITLRIPIMGICRGLQLINIYLGGTLFQDLPSEYPSQQSPYSHPLINHSRADSEWAGVHDIAIEEDSRLFEVLQTKSAYVNSTHHQAIDQLGRTLHVTARSADGVIEAIESDTYPISAVQFHPERLAFGADVLFTRLFSDIVQLTNVK